MDKKPASSKNLRTMQVLRPREKPRNSSARDIPTQKKSLTRIPANTEATSSFGQLPENKAVKYAEQQRLEFLAGHSLKNSMNSKTMARSESLDCSSETSERRTADVTEPCDLEYSFESLQGVLQRSREIGEEVKLKEKKVKELTRFVDYLRTHTNSEGKTVVSFPENYDQIVETVIESREIPGAKDVNWIEFYEEKKHDKTYQDNMKTIQALDRVIWEKEQQMKDHSIQKTSVFVTGVKSTSSFSSQKTAKACPDKIQRNIEAAKNYRDHFSVIDRLTDTERQRIEFLTAENNPLCENYMNLGTNHELEEIDKKLHGLLPAIEWELHSASHCSEDNIPEILHEPKDPVLKDKREQRLTREKLKDINNSLMKLHSGPTRHATEQEIAELTAESALALPSFTPRKAIESGEDALLTEAHTLIHSIENDCNFDVNELKGLYLSTRDALMKYEEILQEKQNQLRDNPVFLASLANIKGDLNSQKGELAAALEQLQRVEKSVSDALAAVQNSEELETQLEQTDVEVPLQEAMSLEEIDREIESKVTFQYPCAEPVLPTVNPEKYPSLYHLYSAVFEEYQSEELIDN